MNAGGILSERFICEIKPDLSLAHIDLTCRDSIALLISSVNQSIL